jgi:SAM-dependent methyltransferase
MTSSRVRRQVFGEVADAYDEVRPGYPVELADRIVAYAGRQPAQIVEPGAGTGKGSVVLRAIGVPLVCVEPDPAMAALLARRFDGDDLVSVEVCRFEDWDPPAGGVDVLASAQAWHWVDPDRRTELAHRALAPGGVLAVFWHQYGFADPALGDALTEVYDRLTPAISENAAEHRNPSYGFQPDELHGSDLFTDVQAGDAVSVVPFDTARYLALLSTFSPHRMLSDDARAHLHAELAAVIDARGGVVDQKLTTALWLARRR